MKREALPIETHTDSVNNSTCKNVKTLSNSIKFFYSKLNIIMICKLTFFNKSSYKLRRVAID